MRLKFRSRLSSGFASFGGLLLALAGLAGLGWHPSGPGTAPAGSNEPVVKASSTNGSKEPIISVDASATPNTGIAGSIQAPAGTTGTQFVTFVVRVQDWDDAHPAVPTTQPVGIVGAYSNTWTYSGTGSNTHSFCFWVDAGQEGTSFYVVVKASASGAATTYTKSLVPVGRSN